MEEMTKDVKLRNILELPILMLMQEAETPINEEETTQEPLVILLLDVTEHYPFSKPPTAIRFCWLQQKTSRFLITKLRLKFTILWGNRKSPCDGANFQNRTMNETPLLANKEVFSV